MVGGAGEQVANSDQSAQLFAQRRILWAVRSAVAICLARHPKKLGNEGQRGCFTPNPHMALQVLTAHGWRRRLSHEREGGAAESEPGRLATPAQALDVWSPARGTGAGGVTVRTCRAFAVTAQARASKGPGEPESTTLLQAFGGSSAVVS